MFEFRVTKYDPLDRDTVGAYMREDWTAVSDIGRTFGGVMLTEPEYQRVENAYATVAVAFMREAGVPSLTVTGLENYAGLPLQVADGVILSLSDATVIVRQVLRAEFWCRLEGARGFIRLGYDYYMYIGVVRPCPSAEALAQQLGLFVEPFLCPFSK